MGGKHGFELSRLGEAITPMYKTELIWEQLPITPCVCHLIKIKNTKRGKKRRLLDPSLCKSQSSLKSLFKLQRGWSRIYGTSFYWARDNILFLEKEILKQPGQQFLARNQIFYGDNSIWDSEFHNGWIHKRGGEHVIPLLFSMCPINVRPYRYAHSKKKWNWALGGQNVACKEEWRLKSFL